MNDTPLASGVADAARRLGLHPDTLRKHIAAGRIRSVRVGRRVLVPESELVRIVEDGGL
jgi:excisionase family DNA binding protein